MSFLKDLMKPRTTPDNLTEHLSVPKKREHGVITDEENCKMRRSFKPGDNSQEELLDEESNYRDPIAYNCEVGADESRTAQSTGSMTPSKDIDFHSPTQVVSKQSTKKCQMSPMTPAIIKKLGATDCKDHLDNWALGIAGQIPKLMNEKQNEAMADIAMTIHKISEKNSSLTDCIGT
uniref:Phosphoprotein n=1 Tax=Romanomermis culicivorax TaxID=13658 RepID=A0A915K6B9_ROMCU